jgi:UDP-sugar pyrophosphorylase
MYVELLREIKQDHIANAYLAATEDERKRLDEQIYKIETAYPGGLRAYHQNGIRLLKESALGINPYENYEIGKPHGITISYDDLKTWEKYERIGMQEFQRVAFVLVAGGLGERLGYEGIKVSIPKELLTEKCFLQYYCEYIHAF